MRYPRPPMTFVPLAWHEFHDRIAAVAKYRKAPIDQVYPVFRTANRVLVGWYVRPQ